MFTSLQTHSSWQILKKMSFSKKKLKVKSEAIRVVYMLMIGTHHVHKKIWLRFGWSLAQNRPLFGFTRKHFSLDGNERFVKFIGDFVITYGQNILRFLCK